MAESVAWQLGNSQYVDSKGETCWYQHVNENQWVLFEGSTVTVEGERCALWGDHNARALEMLKESGIKPTTYETSDSRLQWHETLAGYMETRASYEEASRYCKEKKTSPKYYRALRELALQAERLKQYPERVHAELTLSQLKQVREVLSLT